MLIDSIGNQLRCAKRPNIYPRATLVSEDEAEVTKDVIQKA